MNAFYETSYKNQFGRRVRSETYWEKINRENSINGRVCLGIYLSGELVGYSILRDNVILEISFRDNLNLVNLVCDLSQYLKVNELNFEISSSHLLLKKYLGFDITLSTRECFYGGHIVRITNLKSIIQKFFDREFETLSRSREEMIETVIGSELCQIDLSKRTISSQNTSELSLSQTGENASISYEMTKLLLGCKNEYLESDISEFGFSALPFQISTIDEF